MSREFSLKFRRRGVSINLASAILFVCFFCIAEYGHWNLYLTVSCLLSFSILVISNIRVYVKTGIWKMSRAKSRDLDERQINIVHDAYRRAYDIFTVFSLLVFFFVVLSVRYSFFTLTHRGHYSFGLVMLMFLNYLLNILPAAIMAWSEPVIEK